MVAEEHNGRRMLARFGGIDTAEGRDDHSGLFSEGLGTHGDDQSATIDAAFNCTCAESRFETAIQGIDLRRAP